MHLIGCFVRRHHLGSAWGVDQRTPRARAIHPDTELRPLRDEMPGASPSPSSRFLRTQSHRSRSQREAARGLSGRRRAGHSWTGSSRPSEPEGSRAPRCGPHKTSPRDPRTAPAAQSAAVLPAWEVSRRHPRRPGRRAAPAGGAKRGPLAPVSGPAQQIERSPTSSRYSSRRHWLAKIPPAAPLHWLASLLIVKLTAMHSDSCCSVATSTD
jgi:hypothetical protein